MRRCAALRSDAIGTELPIPNVRSSVANGGKADKICSMRVLRILTQLGHEAALFVAMHATETVRPAIVSPRCLALGHTMFAHVKFESALVGLVCIAVGCMNGRASAVTAE